MAITVSSTPSNIDGHGRFTVTTDKTVSGTYNNLRIRAQVYHEGTVKAIVEKPKGLDTFDFGDILKSLNYGLKLSRNTGANWQLGTLGANLITAFTTASGTFTTLTTSGNAISSAISTVAAIAQSNTVTMAVGELYLAYAKAFDTTGTNAPQLKLDTGGANWTTIENNKGVIIMPTSAGSLRLYVGGQASQNFDGEFYLCKINTDRATVGGMLVPYFVVFTEVYEDSSGVTQTSATSTTAPYRYVPASRFVSTFSTYVMSGSSSNFANMTIRDGAAKYFTSSAHEYFVTFFTEYVDIELFASKDMAAYATGGHGDCAEGWGVVILNTAELMSYVTSSLRLYVEDNNADTAISAALTVGVDTKCNTYRAVLEFIGLCGGTEYLSYNGGAVQGLKSDRKYYTDQYGIRKLISQQMVGSYTLETAFADMYFTDYYAMVFAGTDVKLLIGETTEPVDVTIVSEGGKTSSEEMFTNEIEVEFDYGY